MSIELLIYLAGVSYNIYPIVFLAGLLGVSASSLVFIIYYEEKEYNTICKKVSLISTILLLTSSLIPDPRTIYMMAGASYSKEALQSETALKVKKLIDGKLDEALAELEKK